MDKLALTGLALAVGGAVGIVAIETIGTAHASRPGERDYTLAIGVGAPIKLVPTTAAGPLDVHGTRQRTLVCRGGVMGLGALSVGYRCGGN
jgi:hypothetical protein